MFKKIVEEKYIELKSKIPADIMEFPFYRVLNDILNDSVVQTFLKAELEWWIYEDRLFRFLNHSFKFSKIQNSKVIDKIDDIYRENAIITKDELLDLIKKAIILHYNFILFPLKTLMAFIFSNSAQLTKEELILKLNYFYGYDFIIDGIKLNLHKDIITRIEFEKILRQVLNEYFTKISKDEFKSLLNYINSYFYIEENKISLKLIQILLPQLGLSDLLNLIKNQIKNQVDIISFDELLSIISLDLTNNITAQSMDLDDSENIKIFTDKTFDSNYTYDKIIEKSLDKLMAFYDELSINAQNYDKDYLIKSTESNNMKVFNDKTEKIKFDDILNKNNTDELNSDDIDALFNQ